MIENSLKSVKSKLKGREPKPPLKPESNSLSLGYHILTSKSTKLNEEDISTFTRKSADKPEIWKDFYKLTKPPQNLWQEKAISKTSKMHGATEQQQESWLATGLGTEILGDQ